GNMQTCALPCDGDVDRQDLLVKGCEHVLLQPIPQSGALLRITTFHELYATFQLEHGDDRKVDFRLACRRRPRSNICVTATSIAKLGPNVRIDQVHQSRSADRKMRSPMRGGSKSISSSSF